MNQGSDITDNIKKCERLLQDMSSYNSAEETGD